eukprot:2168643-Amphidinium_carterae.1
MPPEGTLERECVSWDDMLILHIGEAVLLLWHEIFLARLQVAPNQPSNAHQRRTELPSEVQSYL